MSDIIKMDYDAVQNMSQTCNHAAETGEDLIRDLNGIAQNMEGGALLGRGGNAFVAAIRDRLIPRLNSMKDKFGELELDLIGALSDLRDEDQESRTRFE
jgi:hypothetical protein